MTPLPPLLLPRRSLLPPPHLPLFSLRPPLSLHLRRPRPRCRHRRPTPTLQARLPARPLSPRTSPPLLTLSLATPPLLPLTMAMRRSARCSMCTRTKSVSVFGLLYITYREGEDFQRSMCKREASGRHEEYIRHVTKQYWNNSTLQPE